MDRAIGLRLRGLRSRLGLSQTQLGEALGVTFQQVQKYERGLNRISAAALVKAATALGTNVADLVGEGGDLAVGAEALEALARSDAAHLLAAYSAIERPEDRSLVLRLTEALSRPELAWDQADA